MRAPLKAQREVKIGKRTVRTNLAGVVYGRLYEVRNDFLHGNPVDVSTVKLEKCQRSVLLFAAPLFRLALSAHLELKMSPTPDVPDTEAYARYINDGLTFRVAQHLAEDAILKADESPLEESGVVAPSST